MNPSRYANSPPRFKPNSEKYIVIPGTLPWQCSWRPWPSSWRRRRRRGGPPPHPAAATAAHRSRAAGASRTASQPTAVHVTKRRSQKLLPRCPTKHYQSNYCNNFQQVVISYAKMSSLKRKYRWYYTMIKVTKWYRYLPLYLLRCGK